MYCFILNVVNMYFHAATKMSILTQDNKETVFFQKDLKFKPRKFRI